MDYKNIKDILKPYLGDNLSNLGKAKDKINSIKAEDTFDKRVITLLTNIVKNLEINESFKKVTREIIKNADYYSDNSVHQTTKNQHLKKLLVDHNYVENNKQFNLSILQTYVDNILQKQLLEINIKIEENQRILHNLEHARSSKYSKNKKETVSQIQNEAKNELEKESKDTHSKYLFIESEKLKYSIKYDKVLEILKTNKKTASKHMNENVIPYSKVIGLNRGSVIKKTSDYKINKNQPLNNVNVTLSNIVDKNFAVITRHNNHLNIFFVDNVLYTDPVEAEDMGDYAKTFEGNYKTIEV